MPTVSTPSVAVAGSTGICLPRSRIQRRTMSSYVPFARISARKASKAWRRAALSLRKPAATGEENSGSPKDTSEGSARITSARVSTSLRPASILPAVTARVMS